MAAGLPRPGTAVERRRAGLGPGACPPVYAATEPTPVDVPPAGAGPACCGPGAPGGATGAVHRAGVCSVPGVGHGPTGLGGGGAGTVGGGHCPDTRRDGRLVGHGSESTTVVVSGPAGRGLWAGRPRGGGAAHAGGGAGGAAEHGGPRL